MRQTLRHARSCLRLARWLGPWTAASSQPTTTHRATVAIPTRRPDDRPFDAWLYQPRGTVTGCFVVIPGLHYAGPADPRLDRFCSMLAASGIVVLAPFLPDYTAMIVDARAEHDAARCVHAVIELDLVPAHTKTGVFSISFGSLLALKVAASEELREHIGGLVIFGGYADWEPTLHFSLTGRIGDQIVANRDPLNQMVAFMNLIDSIDGAPADAAGREELLAGWRRFAEETWGRDEMKAVNRHQPVAVRIAESLSERLRDLFLVGCGVREGGLEACEVALSKSGPRTAFLDSRDAMSRVVCPTRVVHGREDDVIPYTEAAKFRERFPSSTDLRIHVTGLYGHSGTSPMSSLVDTAAEIRTMARILNDIVAMSSVAA